MQNQMQKTAKSKPSPKAGQPRFLSNLSSALLVFLVLATIYSLISTSFEDKDKISLTELAGDVNAGYVTDIIVRGNDLEAKYSEAYTISHIASSSASASTTALGVKLGTGVAGANKVNGATTTTGSAMLNLVVKTAKKEEDSSITETLTRYGVTAEKLQAVKVTIEGPTGFWFWFGQLSPFLAPFILLGLLIWFLTRQVRGAGVQALSFGQSKARMTLPDDTKQKVTFKDVAGAKEAKQELAEIVDFLRNPKKFLEIGANIPKGVLLMGAPGTGKTLLARAVAGEAGVAFFSISGSEFVEMFVGVGASRVRDLFKMAKAQGPAIIFVDEIDAVGRARGVGMGGSNDEREQTLNQILVEMDGFEPNEKVIVMAATNRPDVLDPALLRPGRFDRRVTIDLPDRADREEILKIHSAKKPFAEDVNLVVIAERTPGFSGADLSSLMNEGAILAAREDRTKVAQYDLVRAIEKVMLGPERKSHLLSKQEKEVTAYHEAGHALVSSVLEHADPVHKISIISRGRAAGYTLHLPIEDKKLQTKKQFLDDLAVSLGGYVTEQMVFGDVTTGPSNDLQVATALARDMVTKYGMSDKLGALAFEGNSGRALFGKGLEEAEYSERVASDIDSEVSRIMSEAFASAKKVLTEYRPALDAIARRLIEVENIERDEYEKIIIAHGIELKRKN